MFNSQIIIDNVVADVLHGRNNKCCEISPVSSDIDSEVMRLLVSCCFPSFDHHPACLH